MIFSRPEKTAMPAPGTTLAGRPTPLPTAEEHFIFGRPLKGPYPDGLETAMFAMGCFWGAERKFWELGAGIWITAVGYAGGLTPNPTYEEVCSGQTGHAEAVLVVFDPAVIGYETLLKTFWESHDPTQGMRQGNDAGTQYRSGLYVFSEAQAEAAHRSRTAYQRNLTAAGFGAITTEIRPAPPFFFAEAVHQQYLAKVPHGYCGLGGTGVACPAPTWVATGPA